MTKTEPAPQGAAPFRRHGIAAPILGRRYADSLDAPEFMPAGSCIWFRLRKMEFPMQSAVWRG